MKLLNKVLLALFILVCAAAAQAQSPSTVLVVGNANNPNSRRLTAYYMNAHGIPRSNMLLLQWDANDNMDTCSLAHYTANIAAPVYNKIAQLGGIDYIVLCRNLPVKISNTGGSVDSALAGRSTNMTSNRYAFQSASTAFSSARFGMYLVTRLDGWSWQDAASLVDRSLAAKPTTSPIFFDCDPSKASNEAYNWFNVSMRYATSWLSYLKVAFILDDTVNFAEPGQPVAGYVSWGSNDGRYSAQKFNNLRFVPGAIVETAVSTSGSNIRFPGGSQSQIALLIRNGATGAKGYVSEPTLSAVALPDRLILNYVQGRNLAEAYYSASPFLGWKDVILGDPLCAPYRK